MVETHDRTSRVDAWFASGERLGYDPIQRRIEPRAALRVFAKTQGDVRDAVTFLPGFPDGSIGWSKPFEYLADGTVMPKLVAEYLGMGDSDKPRGYRYSTAERADLVEALWRHYGVVSTAIVTFDFSSLVVLEILQRRLEGRGDERPHIRGVFTFNGGLFTDGHTHPWYTTPLLRRPGGGLGPWLGRRSRLAFRSLARVMWSPEYDLRDDEVADLFNVLNRRDGLFYLRAGAGFVAEHRAEGDRLDFGRIFTAYRDRVPFVVGGSAQDPFEHRQVDLVESRLAAFGVRTVRLPGGHLTTNEHPRELADAIVAHRMRSSFMANACGSSLANSRSLRHSKRPGRVFFEKNFSQPRGRTTSLSTWMIVLLTFMSHAFVAGSADVGFARSPASVTRSKRTDDHAGGEPIARLFSGNRDDLDEATLHEVVDVVGNRWHRFIVRASDCADVAGV